MLLATSAAVSKDIGLLVTFLGIGLVVNVILVYVAIQVRGERSQNQEYMASRRGNGRPN
jgi:ABC-type transporter Mla subunit MlaD